MLLAFFLLDELFLCRAAASPGRVLSSRGLGPTLEGRGREVGDCVKCGAWPHASSFLSRTRRARKPTPPLVAQDPHPHLTSVI